MRRTRNGRRFSSTSKKTGMEAMIFQTSATSHSIQYATVRAPSVSVESAKPARRYASTTRITRVSAHHPSAMRAQCRDISMAPTIGRRSYGRLEQVLHALTLFTQFIVGRLHARTTEIIDGQTLHDGVLAVLAGDGE